MCHYHGQVAATGLSHAHIDSVDLYSAKGEEEMVDEAGYREEEREEWK